MSTDTPASPNSEPATAPAVTTPECLAERLALWDAVEEAGNRLHPYRTIPRAKILQRQAQIDRDGESQAAWDVDVLSGVLSDVQRLAMDEGLTGLAVALEHAMRILDEAETLYAFAGRDETVTDPQIEAADERWFGPAAKADPRSSGAWLLLDG